MSNGAEAREFKREKIFVVFDYWHLTKTVAIDLDMLDSYFIKAKYDNYYNLAKTLDF